MSAFVVATRIAMIVLVGTLALVGPTLGSARAQPTDRGAHAEQLFLEGLQLADQGRWDEACAKFEASLAIDPSSGTRLNVAECNERAGRIATAWALYREVAEADQRSGNDERLRYATARADALRARLPRLRIAPSKGGPPGLQVTRDGIELDPRVLDGAIFVDPGEHLVIASAPGYDDAEVRIVAIEGEEATATLPALVLRPRPPSRGGRRRTLGLAIGGAGVATVAVGLGFGVGAKRAWDVAFEHGSCDRSTSVCSAVGQTRTDEARTRATVANVLVAGGLAIVAASVVVYVTSPRDEGARSIAVVPVIDSGGTGLAAAGRF